MKDKMKVLPLEKSKLPLTVRTLIRMNRLSDEDAAFMLDELKHYLATFEIAKEVNAFRIATQREHFIVDGKKKKLFNEDDYLKLVASTERSEISQLIHPVCSKIIELSNKLKNHRIGISLDAEREEWEYVNQLNLEFYIIKRCIESGARIGLPLIGVKLSTEAARSILVNHSDISKISTGFMMLKNGIPFESLDILQIKNDDCLDKNQELHQAYSNILSPLQVEPAEE